MKITKKKLKYTNCMLFFFFINKIMIKLFVVCFVIVHFVQLLLGIAVDDWPDNWATSRRCNGHLFLFLALSTHLAPELVTVLPCW